MKPHFLALAILPAAALHAQNVLHGNGIPSAYVETTPGLLGGTLTVGYGSPTTPNSIAVVSISGSFTPTLFPLPALGGPVGINPFDPAYQFFFFGLDAQGHGSTSLPLAPGLLPTTAAPLFVNVVTFESQSQWSVSKTARIDWMNPDSYEAAAPLGTARQLHTATAVGRNGRDNLTEVLICGGATGSIIIPTPMASAELFSPLTRQVTPLPSMSLPRASHRSVRLDNGLVLITGGVTTGGVVTATCEFFDPGTGQFFPAPPMLAPRAGHAITLLDDGRVLVSGGVADWQNAAAQFIVALNQSQNTAEIFDPSNFSWSQLPNMLSKRFGHTQTKLLDGRVLLTSGINGGSTGINPLGTGGQVPVYTPTCEVFDPATLTFTRTGDLGSGLTGPFTPMRGFHGASLLPNGNVLVTGGFVSGGQNGEAVTTSSGAIWDGTNWQVGPTLLTTAAFHTQEPLGQGALIVGGFTGDLTQLQTTATTAIWDGTSMTAGSPIGTDHGTGTPQPRATHTCTRLSDGTFLIYGGGLWPNTLADGWIYAAN